MSTPTRLTDYNSQAQSLFDQFMSEGVQEIINQITFTGSNEQVQRAARVEDAMLRFHFAKLASSYFEKAKEKAQSDLSVVGALDAAALAHPGDSILCQDGVTVQLHLKVAHPRESVDAKKFSIELAKQGVDEHVIDSARTAATKSSAPARTFSTTAK